MSDLRSRHVFTIRILVHPRQDLSATRWIFPVAGGEFEGDRLRGTISPEGGADWLLVRADGTFQQDVRMTLRTSDGALIGMRYSGVRHGTPEVNARISRGESVQPTEYYLRTAVFFETGAPQYGWINNIVAVGIGERLPGGATYRVYEVL